MTNNLESKSKNNDKKNQQEFRVFVNQDAEQAITEFLDDVNRDFNAGRANRIDVASFMITWFKQNASSDVIFDIRRQLANSVSMLDAVYKMAKHGEELPPEVKLALEKHFFGSDANVSKKGKKNLKQEFINDKPIESETV